MEHNPLLSLSSQTSKIIQAFLLTLILLLPDVDPVLSALIKSYLLSADTNNSTPPSPDTPQSQQSADSDNLDHGNEPNADRKSTRLNSSHSGESRMPSSA